MAIELSSYNFPDETFRKYLRKFDVTGDNKLASAERNAVKEIDVSGKGITTLEGISYFPNLFYLNCKKNQLTELDVSKNAQLKGLDSTKNRGRSIRSCFYPNDF